MARIRSGRSGCPGRVSCSTNLELEAKPIILLHADTLKPLRLKITQQQRNQKQQVHANQAHIIAPVLQQMMIESDRRVERGSRETPHERAEGDIDCADSRQAEKVIAQTKGNNMR